MKHRRGNLSEIELKKCNDNQGPDDKFVKNRTSHAEISKVSVA